MDQAIKIVYMDSKKIILKSFEEIELIKKCQLVFLGLLAKEIKPGITTIY